VEKIVEICKTNNTKTRTIIDVGAGYGTFWEKMKNKGFLTVLSQLNPISPTIMKTIYLKLFIELPVLVFARYIRLIGKLLKKDDKLITQRLRDIVNNIIPPTFNHSGIIFDTTTKASTSRGIRLLTKEPDTINWLEDKLRPDDVFYDIGANVGVYSLYAAKKGNAVIAIEPESSNYALLNKNIFLNSFEQKILALNLALYDREVLSTLNMNNYQPGKSGHSFHDEADLYLNPGKPRFRQAVIGMPLDTLVSRYNLSFPNAIKIDVDGNEHKILSGMSKILKDQRLRSIAIEIDSKISAHRKICDLLQTLGFEQLTNSRYINNEDQKTGCYNHFFLRKTA